MLDLWSAPKKTRNGLQATINEKGYITLNAELGEIFVQAPVQVRFTQDFTVMQIIRTAENGVVFPQCRRKFIPEIAKRLKELRVSFPVAYQGLMLENNEKWRGVRRVNPTTKQSKTIRAIGRK